MYKPFLASFVAIAFFATLASQTSAQVIVAEDFRYAQPTKAFGPGGGFTRQDYAGGQNGSGQWLGRWVSVGDGVIMGSDISEEDFNLETDVFTGATRNGLSVNWLERDFTFNGIEDEQTLYFGVTMRSSAEVGQPNSTFFLNDAGGGAAVGMGLSEGGFRALLGNPEETGDVDVIPGPELTEGLDAHRLIGKLEINARGSDERLSVWLNPTDVEMAEEMTQAEADIVGGLSDFGGNLRLDHVGSGGITFWDDLAVGTTWESVATVEVPRVTLLADPDDRQVRWKNETGEDLDVIFLQLESRSLSDRGWNGLADQGLGGFARNNSDRFRLTESSFQESYDLKDGQSFGWGAVYRGSREDLVAHIGTSDGLLNITDVIYGPIPSEGPDTDFDGDGVTDVKDIDLLCFAIAGGENAADFDLTGDGAVNGDDLANFLEEVGSILGDTNLDKTVEFGDFIALSTNYNQPETTWSQGNFDCNASVDFGDFVALSTRFGTTVGEAAAVPEPQGLVLGLMAFLCLLAVRRRK